MWNGFLSIKGEEFLDYLRYLHALPLYSVPRVVSSWFILKKSH